MTVHENDRHQVPQWPIRTGRGLASLVLLLGPIGALYWLLGRFPESIRTGACTFAIYVVLPGIYAGLYWVLLRVGSSLQNFIWVVTACCTGFALYEWHQALTTHDWRHWLYLGVGAFYASGFLALRLWGWRRARHGARQAASNSPQALG